MTNEITFEGDGIPPEKLPVPAGWRILVGMFRIKRTSDGGIILTDEHVEGQGYLRSVAKVLAVGNCAYNEAKYQGGISLDKRKPDPWCKVGDVVLIGQYAGQSILCYEDGEPQTLKILNDDEIIGIIPDINIIKT